MKNFLRILIIAAIFSILFGSFFAYEFYRNASLKEELMTKTEQVAEARQVKTKTEQLQEEVKALEKDLAVIDKQIPCDEPFPFGIVKTLLGVGESLGLKNINFSFTDNTGETFPINASFAKSGGSIPADSLEAAAKHIRMDFECPFAQLVSFVSKLSKLDRLVLVENVDISRSEDIIPNQKICLDVVAYSFVGK